MIDYSDWLSSVAAHRSDEFLSWLAFFLIVFVSVAILVPYAVWVMNHASDKRIIRTIQAIPFVVVLGSGALATCYLAVPLQPDDDLPTFAEQTEQTFGIADLYCDPACPYYSLPSDERSIFRKDRRSASWLEDSRLVHGTIIVDDDQVGLAGPDGTLLQPGKEQSQ